MLLSLPHSDRWDALVSGRVVPTPDMLLFQTLLAVWTVRMMEVHEGQGRSGQRVGRAFTGEPIADGTEVPMLFSEWVDMT